MVRYLTRLETRTKESNTYASHTVLFRLVRRSERKMDDPFTGRNPDRGDLFKTP